MNEVQVITNEWIDTLIFQTNNKISRRKCINEKGSYYFDNETNNLIVIWDGWGKEIFVSFGKYYLHLDDGKFKTKINNINLILDFFNNTIINLSNQNNLFNNNKFYIRNNKLHIYNGLNIDVYYTNDYGKTFHNINEINQNNIPKLIAIVFPQYHEFYENNLFWGKGFTEWTLLKKTEEIVKDELIKYPHKDIGFYNLKNINHRKYMTKLADKYNIHGFCYYHYWFKNKKVMYEPLELMLKDGEPNKPFFFCWANEQWTKRWDGGNNDILLAQDYSDYDGNVEHFNYLLNFFKHPNYIKKNGKPLFVFYRIEEEEVHHIKNIINMWNNLAQINGFDGIHFMRFLGPFNNKINIEELNGFIEFQPGYCMQNFYNEITMIDDEKIFDENNYSEDLYLKKNIDIVKSINDGYLNSGFEHYSNIGEREQKIRTSKYFLYDGEVLYKRILDLDQKYDEQHRGISVGWNNIPRRNYSGDEFSKYPHIWKNINVHNFSTCLNKMLSRKNDDFLFITAWNEWNEQCVLEPSNIDGYDFLTEINNNYLNSFSEKYRKNILYLSHLGGGTEKYIIDLERIFPEYNFIRLLNDTDIIENIDKIHINSIIHYPNFINNRNSLLNYLDLYDASIEKIITIHDYQWIFPDNPNILYSDFNRSIGYIFDMEFIKNLFEKCDKIIFPDNSIYINYNKFICLNDFNNKIFIVNHSDKLINYDNFNINKINDNIINIGFIGNFCEYKGSELFLEISQKHCDYKGYKIIFHVFGEKNGFGHFDDIIFHNKYSDIDIINKLNDNNIHGLVHLSLFEETYCYALTNSINSGLPILYNNLGAFKNRLSDKHDRFIIYQDDNDINYFFDYIIQKNGSKKIKVLSNNIQPNKWYIENY